MSRFRVTRPNAEPQEERNEKPAQPEKFASHQPQAPQQLVVGEDMELLINDERLNQELMNQPLTFRKYTKILSGASKAAKTIKMQLEIKESELRKKHASDGKGKRVAEIEAEIKLDPEYQAIQKQLFDAEERVEEFTGIVKAFHQRHEMLKDLCANKRKELVD